MAAFVWQQRLFNHLAFHRASWIVRQPCAAPPSPNARARISTVRATRTRRTKAAKKEVKVDRNEDTTIEKPSEDMRLPPLTLAHLRDVAVLCGRNSSGTKSALRADLEAAIDEEGHKIPAGSSSRRILSIDMGVRNLAYCLLQVDQTPGPPTLLFWERLSLIGGEKQARSKKATADSLSEPEAIAATSKPLASAFAPSAMAAVAARLIRDRLLPLAPTHVLIERQRFRSGGASAVLEWTVRVNSLEAMLHGIFAYRQLDLAQDDGNSVQSVQAVSPQRVSQFLLRGGIGSEMQLDIDSLSSLPAKSAKEKDIKDVKEAFVAGILRMQSLDSSSRSSRSPVLRYDNKVGDMVDAYLLRWDAKQSRSRPKANGTAAQISLSKIDDLADCVAQGLIWLEWERNKALLREKGAKVLLADKQLPG